MGALPLLDPGQEPDETLTALHKAVVDSAYDVINLKVTYLYSSLRVCLPCDYKTDCVRYVVASCVFYKGIHELGHWHVDCLHCKGSTQ